MHAYSLLHLPQKLKPLLTLSSKPNVFSTSPWSLNHNRPSMMGIQLIQKRNPPSPPSLHHHTPHLLPPSDSQNQTPDRDRRPFDLAVVGLVAVSGTNGVDYPLDEMNNSTRSSRRGGSNQVQLSSLVFLWINTVWLPRNRSILEERKKMLKQPYACLYF